MRGCDQYNVLQCEDAINTMYDQYNVPVRIYTIEVGKNNVEIIIARSSINVIKVYAKHTQSVRIMSYMHTHSEVGCFFSVDQYE